MAKSENQKLKLLRIKDLLYQKTDENHALTTKDIIEELGKADILAERKTIYQDIETLEEYGLDIIHKQERPNGYYLGSREFELAELKLLVDVVQSSRFLTEKKSRELIRKLEGLTDCYSAKSLQRHVTVTNRTKSPNEHIYYNVDLIHRAMAENRQISFQYTQWTMEKKLKERKQGARYQVSPWELIWDDENYYLIAYNHDEEMLKYYRVDKLMNPCVEEDIRQGRQLMDGFDPAEFARRTFGMFSGKEEQVSMKMANDLIGVVMDRFGQDISIRSLSESYFEARTKVTVSGQFFGWLAGLGQGAVIRKPEWVKQEYEKYLEAILKNQIEEGEQ